MTTLAMFGIADRCLVFDEQHQVVCSGSLADRDLPLGVNLIHEDTVLPL